MTFFGAIYKLFIGPLELFFEIVFVIADRLIGNLGLSIIVLSLVMNFLVLPLYKRADAMQEEQRETENRLKKWVTHIKKTFKGDERFMMLQTYYRQNGYKPTSILKGSVSLLLEIPFFIAAYNFLSHAGVFNGFAFGPFTDMGKPDGLIKIAGLSINLLPILMTTINIISSAIYTKGLPTSSKVQLYGMAGIFLVLLYNSPAALVFYWTLNNLFSLAKNLFYKLKKPELIFGILCSIVGICSILFAIIHPFNTYKKNLFVILFSLFVQFPLILFFLKKHISKPKDIKISKNEKIIFYIGAAFLTVLSGLLIPSAVIQSSPEEFINTALLTNPLSYILTATLIAAGTFIIWFNIFYGLATNTGKRILEIIICILSLGGIINYMFFGKNLGTLSPTLKLDVRFHLDKMEIILNSLILIFLVLAICFIIKRNKVIFGYILSISTVCIIIMAVLNCSKINSAAVKKIEKLKTSNTGEVSIPLSKTGKNVMIFMMDRAINAYIPYIFNEKPEVAEQFEGFTYYPNTMSFGGHTNFGLPSVFGGYEYTPKELNKRNKELLEDKHNEAMKVLPVLFSNKGFKTTVCDPTYAGYDWIPDLSIYDEYPDIDKYITMQGKVGANTKEETEAREQVLNRNFFLYSIMKISPLFIQETIYNKGNFNKIDTIEHIVDGLYKATGIDVRFNNSFKVLKNLPVLTKIVDNNKNTFFMICNETTHSPCLLQEPEYEPQMAVDNTEYEKNHSDRYTLNSRTMKMNDLTAVEHYQINMAAMIQLGKYFDYLRANNVFDNTKILIVADHGYPIDQFDDLRLKTDSIDDIIMRYNPLLLIKDFNSKEFKVDNEFMTNADVPTFAVKDLIEEPINPFTGKLINNEEKYAHDQYIITSYNWETSVNNGTTYAPSKWLSCHDNIFVKENWNSLPEE